MARDYFHFVTKFFEPINASAIHIYHSALELSPLLSIVRRLYYHQRHTPFPIIQAGTPDSWDQSLALPHVQSKHNSYAWSPCGRFVAVQTKRAVGIHDPLTFELLSTLLPTEPTSQLLGMLAYSPDGHSLASFSETSLIIWDIQTGGVVKEVLRNEPSGGLLAWSLDGRTISNMETQWGIWYNTHTVHTYDITSDTMLLPTELQLSGAEYFWAHDMSFLTMEKQEGGQAYVINIFEVGADFNKIKSFHINLGTRTTWAKFFGKEEYYKFGTFSPTTYRVSMVDSCHFLILDIQNSHCLLNQRSNSHSHCFSSDGSLFAASSTTGVQVWKYTSSHYTPWREFPSSSCYSSCFSPTSSSILGSFQDNLQVWRFDGSPIVAHSNNHESLAVPSSCGTYVVTGCGGENTITITNLLSQVPPQFINTGMKMEGFALTGNVLLVEDSKMIAAWLLKGEGVVEGLFGGRGAGRHDRIWTIPRPSAHGFIIQGQVVAIQDGSNGKNIHAYHTRTGEVLEPTKQPLHNHVYMSFKHMYHVQHYPHYRSLNVSNTCPEDNWPVSQTMLQEAWVKDPEGKHRLWIPVEWRKHSADGGWLYNLTTLNLSGNVIIKF
jgi:hypothetical protein